MREIYIASTVREKVEELRAFLTEVLKLSEQAAYKRVERMDRFIQSFANEHDYSL